MHKCKWLSLLALTIDHMETLTFTTVRIGYTYEMKILHQFPKRPFEINTCLIMVTSKTNDGVG